LKITRGCLEVLARFRNPAAIITKNRLVTETPIFCRNWRCASHLPVNISVTSLDPSLQRVLEPRTSAPAARLEAIEKLRRAGIPVGVMVAQLFRIDRS